MWPFIMYEWWRLIARRNGVDSFHSPFKSPLNFQTVEVSGHLAE